jgi:hypothetical protein
MTTMTMTILLEYILPEMTTMTMTILLEYILEYQQDSLPME